MVDDGVESIGLRLRRLRRDRAMTQEELAEEAGLSVAIIQKLEQGRRSSARTSTLIALAYALDADLSELVGKRPRLDRGDDGVRVLALRDALLAPELLLDSTSAPRANPWLWMISGPAFGPRGRPTGPARSATWRP